MTPDEHELDGQLPGSGPWVLAMRWTDLLFAHWRIPPDVARRLVPAPLEPDLHEGAGWLGLVPFRMERTRPRMLPPIPPISRFAEVNVRTYATYRGRRGVWFLSLDAAGRVGSFLGRHAAGLPYHWARMRMDTDDGWIAYRSDRPASRHGAAATLQARYRPRGPVRPTSPLETFLADRDGLWTLGREGVPRWLAIRHAAWPLQDADAAIERQTLTDAAGVRLDRPPDHVAFSRCVDVVAWRPSAGPLVRADARPTASTDTRAPGGG